MEFVAACLFAIFAAAIRRNNQRWRGDLRGSMPLLPAHEHIPAARWPAIKHQGRHYRDTKAQVRDRIVWSCTVDILPVGSFIGKDMGLTIFKAQVEGGAVPFRLTDANAARCRTISGNGQHILLPFCSADVRMPPTRSGHGAFFLFPLCPFSHRHLWFGDDFRGHHRPSMCRRPWRQEWR